MSGGSMDYVCWDLEGKAAGKLMDKELEAMLKDFCKVLHDCEWYHSCDIGEEEYRNTVKEFKKRWFGSRDEHLKEIIEESIASLRKELVTMIGVDDE